MLRFSDLLDRNGVQIKNIKILKKLKLCNIVWIIIISLHFIRTTYLLIAQFYQTFLSVSLLFTFISPLQSRDNKDEDSALLPYSSTKLSKAFMVFFTAAWRLNAYQRGAMLSSSRLIIIIVIVILFFLAALDRNEEKLLRYSFTSWSIAHAASCALLCYQMWTCEAFACLNICLASKIFYCFLSSFISFHLKNFLCSDRP